VSGILFDPTMRGLAEALTLHQRRHEVLASNLANVETPRFKAKELDFEDTLRAAFETEPAAVPELAGVGGLEPRVVEDAGAPARADGNTVDLDLQMAKLAANGGRYVALAKLLQLRILQLRLAIEGNR
jgi:flagellar basal-body rod protein FlgB